MWLDYQPTNASHSPCRSMRPSAPCVVRVLLQQWEPLFASSCRRPPASQPRWPASPLSPSAFEAGRRLPIAVKRCVLIGDGSTGSHSRKSPRRIVESSRSASDWWSSRWERTPAQAAAGMLPSCRSTSSTGVSAYTCVWAERLIKPDSRWEPEGFQDPSTS